MPLINFPNLPNVPGVPQIPRLPNISLPSIINIGIGFAQDQILGLFAGDSQWGIFDSKGKALGDPKAMGSTSLVGSALASVGISGGLVDKALSYVGAAGAINSFNSLDYTKPTRVSDFPVERGSFASYNKVEQPSAPVVTFNFQGTAKECTSFLKELDKATKSTDLYSVVTPTATYVNHNIESMDYSRSADAGANLLVVRLMLKEIRQVSSQYTQAATTPIVAPKEAGATSLLDAGKIQAAIPGVSTLKSAADKIKGFVNNPLGSLF